MDLFSARSLSLLNCVLLVNIPIVTCKYLLKNFPPRGPPILSKSLPIKEQSCVYLNKFQLIFLTSMWTAVHIPSRRINFFTLDEKFTWLWFGFFDTWILRREESGWGFSCFCCASLSEKRARVCVLEFGRTPSGVTYYLLEEKRIGFIKWEFSAYFWIFWVLQILKSVFRSTLYVQYLIDNSSLNLYLILYILLPYRNYSFFSLPTLYALYPIPVCPIHIPYTLYVSLHLYPIAIPYVLYLYPIPFTLYSICILFTNII